MFGIFGRLSEIVITLSSYVVALTLLALVIDTTFLSPFNIMVFHG